MVEMFAGFGLVSKELFSYNRENFQFDQGQRLERDLMRLDMQIKRFNLFREDIRDLVELCVGRMEMYHLVGAMFLEFCVALYCEGDLKGRAPPFLLGLFYLSVASSYLYLVLAVWLSMHASICAHSLGVRLLTRYVRLPIPSISQMSAMNARLTDFEQQGAKGMLRVPFVGSSQQEWLQRVPVAGSSAGGGAASSQAVPVPNQAYKRDLLGGGEQALLNEEEMMKATSKLPGKHVMLFRRLQCKWQCYDAYARVCMSLGCNMILQSICYYLINVCLLQYQAKSCCVAVIVAFQLAALVVAYVDVAKLGLCNIVIMQMTAMLPCFLAAASMIMAMSGVSAEDLSPDRQYIAGPVCFLLVAVWFECLLRLAWPSQDEATLPRRFRAVMFLDVFEEAIMDPTKAEEDGDYENEKKKSKKHMLEEQDTKRALAERAVAADEAVHRSHCALRRWEAVPAGLSSEQLRRLSALRQQHTSSHDALYGEAVRLAARQGVKDAQALLDKDHRPWDELSEKEQAEDPFNGLLLGPFEHKVKFGAPTSYHFDLEHQDFVWQIGDGQQVLTLDEVSQLVDAAERQVRQVLSSGPGHTSSDEDGTTDTATGTSSDEGSVAPNKRPLARSGTAQFVSGAVGKAENPYVPVRLPWKVVHWATRSVQLAWFFMAVMLTIEYFTYPHFTFDTQLYPENHAEDEHRNTHYVAPGRPAVETHGGAGGHGAAAGEAEPHHDLPEGTTQEPGGIFQPWAPSPTRRLGSAGDGWRFEPLEATWPSREFFRPEGMSCLPDGGDLLIGTPYELYKASPSATDAPGSQEQLLLESLSRATFPAGAAALCAAPSERPSPMGTPRCLLGAPVPGGAALWPFGAQRHTEAVELVIEGTTPWQLLTGAIMKCSNVAELLTPEEAGEAVPAEWCLLLAGWDGERLPVAAVPLPEGPSKPPPRTSAVVPIFDAPLRLLHGLPGARAAKATAGLEKVVALHLEPRAGRLWALLADGALQAWELPTARSLGRWWPQWPLAFENGGFVAGAVCEAASGKHLLVAGRGAAAGAQLLRAELPAMA